MKSLNKIAFFLMLCWMVVIFMFSAEPDTESSELSGSVSYRIVSVVNTITSSHWDEKELLDKAELIDYPVRKCAHISEYAILTLLGFVTFSFLHGRKRFVIPIGVTFLYACTDEIHQLFVPGRAGKFTDVMIDTTGGIIMLLFIALVTHVARKRHTAGTTKQKT